MPCVCPSEQGLPGRPASEGWELLAVLGEHSSRLSWWRVLLVLAPPSAGQSLYLMFSHSQQLLTLRLEWTGNASQLRGSSAVLSSPEPCAGWPCTSVHDWVVWPLDICVQLLGALGVGHDSWTRLCWLHRLHPCAGWWSPSLRLTPIVCPCEEKPFQSHL